MITIVDYGMGNLGSVQNMFKKVGVKAIISNNINEISRAEKLILPGVGSFDAAMERIHSFGFFDILNRLVIQERVPVLGICLGMQLMLEKSDEGKLPGFGWIKGNVNSFRNELSSKFKVPHMGWNSITVKNPCPITEGFSAEFCFYFVHSFFAKVEDLSNQMLTCNYGVEFEAGICKDNIFGVQFHPEKSHKYGMQLFRNFSRI